MFRKTLTSRGGYGPKPSFHNYNQLRKEYERGPSTDKYFTRHPGSGEIQYKGHDVNDHRKWYHNLPGTGNLSGGFLLWPLISSSRNQVPDKVVSSGDFVVAGRLKSEAEYIKNDITEMYSRPTDAVANYVSYWPQRFLKADTRYRINPTRYRSAENTLPKFKRGAGVNDPRALEFDRSLLEESMLHANPTFGQKYRAALQEGMYGPSRAANAKKAKALSASSSTSSSTALIPAGEEGAAAGQPEIKYAVQSLSASANRPFQIKGLPNPESPVAPVAAQYKGWQSIKL